MTQEEFSLLGPVHANWLKVYCKSCDKAIAKRGIFTHIEQHHLELLQCSWYWWIKNDYNMVKQGKTVDAASAFNLAYGIFEADLNQSQQLMLPGPAEMPPAQGPLPEEDSEAPSDNIEELPPAQGPLPEEAPGANLDEEDLARQPAAQNNQLACLIHESEGRVLTRIDQVVEGFNIILQQGLGEVQAKYQVALPDWFLEWNVQVNGRLFPPRLLASNYNLEDFKLTIMEFRGLSSKTAGYILKDINRFLGCYLFPDEAGFDLANLMISIFKLGLLKPLLCSELWNAKHNYLKSLRTSMKHFLDYLEHEQRAVRAFGGLTTALQSLIKALEYEMSAQQKHLETNRRNKKATKDAQLIDSWVGAQVYNEMVLLAFQALKYITTHAWEDGFWDKWIHLLANQMLVVIIFLNTYPGRCGGWELITKEEMETQLAGELVAQKGILEFVKHKTVKIYGPLKKWTPRQVLEALLWYKSLPLAENREYFISSHTEDGDEVRVGSLLQSACITLGHPGVAPDTNFIRKLFHSVISSSGGLGENFNEDLKDLAEIDAHAYSMAKSIHYDLSDRLDGPLIKKSIRAFYNLNRRLPASCPNENLTPGQFAALRAGMGKRGAKKRPLQPEDHEGEQGDDAGEFPVENLTRAQKYQKIKDYGAEFLQWHQVEQYKNWMFWQISEDLFWNEGISCSYFQVRYCLKGS